LLKAFILTAINLGKKMDTKDKIKNELANLIKDCGLLYDLCGSKDKFIEFSSKYQEWYSRALKLISLLGPDRLDEFRSYYLIDSKRKFINAGNYVIQDYMKGIGAPKQLNEPLWDIYNILFIRIHTQTQILQSLASRIDSILADVQGHMLAELQDGELKAAKKLMAINLRAAGALAGVVLERHLQRAAINHGLKITKANPTISDLNDPLRQAGVYDVTMWRKIQLLGDIRNICSHNKNREPRREEVEELISGVNSLIKTIF
jgi:hypothetical protein